MSQWGQEVRIDNARFVPLVDGEAFADITRESIVLSVLIVDDGGHPEQALRLLQGLELQQRGQPYGAWLDMPGVEHMAQPNS